MEALSLAKVLMVTMFFWNGAMDIIREETTLGLCNQAKVEAAHFTNRYLGMYEEATSKKGTIKVVCHWLTKSKEV